MMDSFKQPPTANTEQDREARLAAIEARLGASKERGVQKGGGKLASKLEESKSGKRAPAPANDGKDEAVELWKTG
ncbi:hypothetical protein HDV05_001928 [Chytridiales sp. JEL 0842]|nr:hypothetical protein HDV05_001928 [Chytridiales sp. JEL 0842]